MAGGNSGDVHLAAVGQFYSNPKLGIAKHKDFRYMPNIVSSAIVNTPPPDIIADVLNKRNVIHHFDKETDEDMIPMFAHGVDGKPRNNKRLLPHRNWCSIRRYVPGNTPPPSPTPSDTEEVQDSPLGSRAGSRSSSGVLRRLSKSNTNNNRGPSSLRRLDGPLRREKTRPPLSGGILRSLSRSRRADYRDDGDDGYDYDYDGDNYGRASPSSGGGGGGGRITRTLSLGRGEGSRLGGLIRRLSNASATRVRRPDDGGINGQWGESDGEDEEGRRAMSTSPPPPPSGPSGPPSSNRIGLRGGAGEPANEYEAGDESLFSVRTPRRAQTIASESRLQAVGGGVGSRDDVGSGSIEPRPFHRTPTGLSTKQLKRARDFEVNLEDGLEVCLNVEVNRKDPAGITVPYRLLIPKLWYNVDDEVSEAGGEEEPKGIKRWISLRRGSSSNPNPKGKGGNNNEGTRNEG